MTSTLNARKGIDHSDMMAPVYIAEVEALRRELTLKNEIIKLLTKELHNAGVNRVGKSRIRLQQISTKEQAGR
jgi:hypothetical protein